MQAGAIAAKMAGYQDSAKVEHEHNINVRIQQMSDAELECEYRRMLSEAMQSMTPDEIQELLEQIPIEPEYSKK